MKSTVLYIVIPCYNEEKVLPITAPMFLEEMRYLEREEKISTKSRIMFVNDGSKDHTWDIIKKLSEEDEHYCGIAQSRNRGHQNAVLAGMMEAKSCCADIVISIDCDGQDDIHAMEEMIDLYDKGSDIVYGVRDNRDSDTLFKKNTAQLYYKLLELMGVEVVYNHADYRLISKPVLDAFSDFKEVNLFLRGMFPLVGFKSASVYYKRTERMAGKSHYPLTKMMALACDGITSLSIKPIRLITAFGMVVTLLSVLGIVWAVVSFTRGTTIVGWSSTICMVLFLGGVQLISVGIIGEYVGKIYMEVKHRPRYIISERTYDEKRGYERRADD